MSEDQNRAADGNREVHVSGSGKFRGVSLFSSLIAGVATLIILILEPRPCD